MASTYVNDLRLNEMATGDQSGSWGTVTNTNLELIGEALGYGTQQVFGSDANATTEIADGASDPARAMYFKVTSAGNLTATRTMTVDPDTVSRLMFIENATSGSQSIAVKQGSGGGAAVTIPTGQTKAVILPGSGSGSIVLDAFAALSVVDLLVDDDLTVTDDVSIGGTALVTGVLTTTAATVFNGGFAANVGSTITTADNTTQLTLSSTDADASAGPVLDLFRNSATPANFDPMGKISFSGEDAGGNKTEYVHQIAYPHVVTAGSESGYWELHSLVGAADKVRITVDKDAVIINESGFDTDFRVESNDNPNMLFVDGLNNRVGIGTNTPQVGTLHVHTASAGTVTASPQADDLVVESNTEAGITILSPDDQTARIRFSSPSTNTEVGGATIFYRQNINKMKIGTAVSGGVLELASGEDVAAVVIAANGSVSTPTSGANNVRLGANAGDALTSNSVRNVIIGDDAGSALDAGDESVLIGYNAGEILTSGTQNVAIGALALQLGVSATNNVAVGRSAMASTLGSENVAVGINALTTNQGGSHSVAIGSAALTAQNPSSGNVDFYNTAVGSKAGTTISTGVRNTLIGGIAGRLLTTTQDNVAVGYGSLQKETSGARNVAIGSQALFTQNVAGGIAAYNTAVGYGAAYYLTVGKENTLIGGSSGDALTDADYNVAVGQYALSSDTTGSQSTAIGYAALFTQDFTDGSSSRNTAVGYQAGNLVSNGTDNTLIGHSAGDALQTGYHNTAVGHDALGATDDGIENVAVGMLALGANCGDHNTAVGQNSLGACTGANNTVVGHDSGSGVTSGDFNTFMGADTGLATCTGDNNTGIGYGALQVVTSGASNTAVGDTAGFALTSGSNNLFLGHDAGRSSSPGGAIDTGSNTITLGNNSIATANVKVDWTIPSDQRDKTDFTALDIGLDFVKALNPVTYKWDQRSDYDDQTPDGTHKKDWLDLGFKAQEVEALEIAAGYNKANKTNLTVSLNPDGEQYGMKYSKFIPILVKAIQEQNALIEALTARVATLEG